MSSKPTLTFFCELAPVALQALFADGTVLDDLVALEAQVSLGLLDLGPERADVVRRLNAAGIPVVAWLLLPVDQGYWFNIDNGSQATARYADFQAWTAENNLQWAAVGVDIEPDIQEIHQLLTRNWRVLPGMVRRIFDGGRVQRAQTVYRSLIAQMRADGYRVDSYHIPLIVDERQASSTLFQRFIGLVDLPADREVLMLYSSFLRPRGTGILWSYGPDAQSVGVGSTGGGVEAGGLSDVPPLDWEEFSQDLRLAHHWTDDLHIFSLEGCVAQGFLSRLKGFDWEQPVTPPLTQATSVRRVLQAILRISNILFGRRGD